MQLPVPKDFVPDWDGKTLCGTEGYSDIANTMLSLFPNDGYRSIWTSESRGVGTGQFWDYQIVWSNSNLYGACIELYNYHKNHYSMTVCKP